MAPEPSEPLADRVIVITGAGNGIGLAAAQGCAAAGASVAALDLDPGAAERIAGELPTRPGARAIGLGCDVRDEEAVAAAVDRASNELGRVRGLVTSAGIDRGGLAHELATDIWHEVITTNLTGTYLACKHVLAAMLRHQEGGSIVCVSSPFAELSAPGGASAYCASKGGVSALVRSLALDYAPQGIRVNAIVPGATDTALMWASFAPEAIPAARARIANQIPLGRLADTDDIARGITWLLSDQSCYATGSHLVIDGGLMARANIEA